MAAAAKGKLGAEVRPVSRKELDKFGLTDIPGVALKSVDSSGPLGREGIERNDIILGIDGEPVTGVDSFDYLISAIPPGSTVVLTVLDHRTSEVEDVTIKFE
jgi:serine protease Do